MQGTIHYCPEVLPQKDKPWIFLMGPIQGAPRWQEDVVDLYTGPEALFLCPRRKENPKGNEDEKKVFSDEDYKKQVEWETQALRLSDIILCWIPLPAEDIPGRNYAQTTRFELGENLARGKKVLVGAHPNIPGLRYFQHKLVSYHQCALGNSLKDLLLAVENILESKKRNPKIWFTSDTHFGSSRALEYSRRPFQTVEDMDWKMMENWNNTISPYDTIYHLGDFGDMEKLKYLNGAKKCLSLGNYEVDERTKMRKGYVPYFNFLKETYGWDMIFGDGVAHNLPFPDENIKFCHEPSIIKEDILGDRKLGINNTFGLFGHIHGRQKIKKWGIDVGVDANNFTPVSLEYVEFIKKAITDGVYDEEVWS